MKKTLTILISMLLMAALAKGTYSISGSVGYSGAQGLVGGVEASWDCQLYQPKFARIRPTIDLEYGAAGIQGAALIKTVNQIPNTPMGAGVGLGVRYAGGLQAYARLDGMLKLDKIVGYPILLGADVGYAYGFGATPSEIVAHFKTGYCFKF